MIPDAKSVKCTVAVRIPQQLIIVIVLLILLVTH